MTEHWYVVPATFALRHGGQGEREVEQIEWRLPEAWGKSGEPAGDTIEVIADDRISVFGSR